MSAISMEEFSKVQNALVMEKTARYEAESKEKKLTTEYTKLKGLYTKMEQDMKKVQALFDKTKDKNALLKMQQDIDNLKRALDTQNNEHLEQNNALRKNMQLVYQKHTDLEKESAELKTAKERLEGRLIELKKKDIENSALVQKLGSKCENLEKIVQYMEEKLQEQATLDKNAISAQLTVSTPVKQAAEDHTVAAEEKPAEQEEVAQKAEEGAENEKPAAEDGTRVEEQKQAEEAKQEAKAAVEPAQTSEVATQVFEKLWSSKISELASKLKEARSAVELAPEEQAQVKVAQEQAAVGADNSGSSGKSADQDLLNTISKLEAQLKETREKLTEEKDSLQGQIVMWQEKSKIKQKHLQETEDKLKEAQDGHAALVKEKDTLQAKLNESSSSHDAAIKQKDAEIAKLNANLAKVNGEIDNIVKRVASTQQDRDQQMRQLEEQIARGKQLQAQIEALNKKIAELTQQNAQITKTATDLQSKIKHDEPVLEKGRKYDALHKELELEQEKVKKSVIDMANAHSQAAELRKQLESLSDKNKKLSSSTIQLQDQIHTLQQQNESVSKEREQIIAKCKEYVAEVNSREGSLKTTIDMLNDKHVKLNQCIADQDEDFVKLFTSKTLLSAQYNIEKKEFKKNRTRFDKLVSENAELQQQVSKLQEENNSLSQAVNNVKVEYQLQLKKSNQLVKELRSQLSSITKGGNNSAPAHSPSISAVKEENARQHIRTSSSSSIGSADGPQTPVKVPSPQAHQAYPLAPVAAAAAAAAHSTPDLLQRDNQLLLTKVSDLQQSRYKLDERVRMLEENVMLLHEDIEKKSSIINYYVQREKTGRISSEGDQHKNDIAKKKDIKGVAANIVPPKLTKEVFDRMQQVMEETLLHNIQLQQDIKTLGDEVARLLEDNRIQKKKYDELAVSKLSNIGVQQQQGGNNNSGDAEDQIPLYQQILMRTAAIEGPKKDPTAAANALLQAFSKITASSSASSSPQQPAPNNAASLGVPAAAAAQQQPASPQHQGAAPQDASGLTRTSSSPVMKPKPKVVKKKKEDQVPKSLYRREF